MWKFKNFSGTRPLVDIFEMYLCADADTFSQNVSVPIQIQYQYFLQVSDSDTKFGNFPVIFCQFWSNTNGIR